MLNLGCDCEVCFLNPQEARIVQNHGKPKKLSPIKVWFVVRVYKMRNFFGNRWVEYGVQLT